MKGIWHPIEEADKTIVDVFDLPDIGITVRNSAHIMARDSDGRFFECCWTDHRGGYWWDLEQESPVDPVDFQPLDEPCENCGPGIYTGLPGNACENCLNTGLKYHQGHQPLAPYVEAIGDDE